MMSLWLLLTACAGAEPAPTPAATQHAPPACPQTTAQLAALHPDLDASDPRLAGEDLIVVRKAARETLHYERGTATGCWEVGLGFTPTGHKVREGDGTTPEGWYRTSDKPWSAFYGAIYVHYPNEADAQAALDRGQISTADERKIRAALRAGAVPPQATPMGGEILLHGGGGRSDWTFGCVAFENSELDALRARLPSGMRTDVLILP